MLNGVLPLKVQLLEEIPHNFPVTDEMVTGQLEPGRRLSQELKVGFSKEPAWIVPEANVISGRLFCIGY